MIIKAFITHKKSESYSGCQDRFSISPQTHSIALSDGMSQSVFQKYWAEILVEKFTSTRDWIPNLESVNELSTEWKKKVQDIVEKLKGENNPHWLRAERNLKDGKSAGATFLGLRFNKKEWVCNVLGDSCLILLQNNKIQKIITSEDVLAFDNHPDYYDSNPNNTGKGTLKTEKGILLDNEIILLVTDPFSDLLLKHKGTEYEAQLVDKLLTINNHDEFENVVEELRNNGMHNDDSTLVVIEPSENDEFIIKAKDDICELSEKEKYIEPNIIGSKCSINKSTSILNVNTEETSMDPIDVKIKERFKDREHELLSCLNKHLRKKKALKALNELKGILFREV